MPPSNYTVASVKQLRGKGSIKHRVKLPQDKILQLPSLELDIVPPGTLRRERRKLSPANKVLSITVPVETPQDSKITAPNIAGDIYFSPVQLSPRTVCLSDPFLRRDSTVLESSAFTKMLVAFPKPPVGNPAKQVRAAACSTSLSKLTIPPAELNEIVMALANCPLVRSSLHERYPHNIAESHSGQGTPSSSSGSLYSQPNKQFVTSSPQAIAPSFELTSTALGAVTILDATKPDQLLLSSSHPRDVTKDVTAKNHPFITMSQKTSYASTLHTLCGSSKREPVKIALQIMNTGIDYEIQQPFSFLSVEHDVTDIFKRAALAELAQHADLSVDNIFVSDNDEIFSNKNTNNEDLEDWMLYADKLQWIGETTDKVDAVLTKIQQLDAESCTMQTLTLMSELSRTVGGSVDSIVVRVIPRAGQRSQAKVLQVSRSMSAKLEDMDCYAADSPIRKRASQCFLRKVCSMVVDNEHQRGAYKVNGAYSLTQLFNNVPMYNAASAQPYAWTVFVQPGFKQWQMI